MSLTDEQKQKIKDEEEYRHEIRKDIHHNNKERSKLVAALLAIFLGGIGIHKFYLGKTGWGVIYLLLCWTFIPAIIGLIEGIRYLVMSEGDFHKKYSQVHAGNMGCSTIVLIVLGVFALLIIVSTALFSSSPQSNIGKYGYNKTNGVYRGKIIEEKACTTNSSVQCYVLEMEGYSRPMEGPVDNVEVKDYPPSE